MTGTNSDAIHRQVARTIAKLDEAVRRAGELLELRKQHAKQIRRMREEADAHEDALLQPYSAPARWWASLAKLDRCRAGLPLDAAVRRYQAHLQQLLQVHDITASFEAASHAGYSWPGLRVIEIPPIRSSEAYAIGLHEVGHVVAPCARHQRHARAKHDPPCCACEIAAWHFAIDRAVEWIPTMHTTLAYALGTYRKNATPDEQIELDQMVGDHGHRLARFRRLTRR